MRRQFGVSRYSALIHLKFESASAGHGLVAGIEPPALCCPAIGLPVLIWHPKNTKRLSEDATMARIDYSDTAKANDRTRELLTKNRNANIFRMMAYSPSHLEQYCRLGGAIRHKGELDPLVRELAITRTGILCEAPYEIVAHKRIGRNVGVTDEQNAALEQWQQATCFNDVQRAALAFTDEIVSLRRPTDATFKAIASKLTPGALIELQLSVGFYIMTSKFLETFEIDMQPVEDVV
jgi:alkylhydroperoxidase family enzyme